MRSGAPRAAARDATHRTHLWRHFKSATTDIERKGQPQADMPRRRPDIPMAEVTRDRVETDIGDETASTYTTATRPSSSSMVSSWAARGLDGDACQRWSPARASFRVLSPCT